MPTSRTIICAILYCNRNPVVKITWYTPENSPLAAGLEPQACQPQHISETSDRAGRDRLVYHDNKEGLQGHIIISTLPSFYAPKSQAWTTSADKARSNFCATAAVRQWASYCFCMAGVQVPLPCGNVWYTHFYIDICIYIYTHLIYLYVCAYVYIYIYIHTYIHIIHIRTYTYVLELCNMLPDTALG